MASALLNCAAFALDEMQGQDGTSGSACFGVDDWYVDAAGLDCFGWNPFKAVAKAVGGVAKTAAKVYTAPQRFVAGTAIDIAKGKNVLKTLKKQGTEYAKSQVAYAKLVGNVATFIPGIGTGVAFAIKYTGSVGDAVLAGKNVLAATKTAAINAALNSLPGGDFTGALIKTVANVTKAGLEGQNLLKSAAHELVGSAVGLIPNEQAQAVLAAAADAALKGENVLQGVKAAAIQQALAQIPDPNARAVVQATLQGKPLTSVVQTAGTALLSKAAGAMPTGGIATIVTGITGKTPDQIHAAAPVIVKGVSGISAPVRAGTPKPAQAAVKPKVAPVTLAAPKPAAVPAARPTVPQATVPAARPVVPQAAAPAARPVVPQAAPAPVVAQPAAPTQLAPVPIVLPSVSALPPMPFGARRVAGTFGRMRVTHDISPQGFVATYVT